LIYIGCFHSLQNEISRYSAAAAPAAEPSGLASASRIGKLRAANAAAGRVDPETLAKPAWR